MQDNVMQVQAQPYVKLMQANMNLFSEFSSSPEVSAQASANASQLFQQATQSAMNVMQSTAFMRLMQGMVKNYTEFVTELGQGAMQAMSQGQASFANRVQEAAGEVIDATEARARRAR